MRNISILLFYPYPIITIIDAILNHLNLRFSQKVGSLLFGVLQISRGENSKGKY